jgi:hypothetical protein
MQQDEWAATVEMFGAQDYGIARELLQRGVGAVYALAFVAVVHQWRPLLGERGLTPAITFLERVPFKAAPSLFHWRYSDRLAVGLGGVGFVLALTVVAGIPQRSGTAATIAVFTGLFVLYLSYVNVGQIWYGFGWESILLEAGFLVMFLGGQDATVPWPTLLLIRWLLFRIEFGAGLIKLRGDRCWRDLTCLDYHHETQPLPGPLSARFHHLPRPMHRLEVGVNHVTQLVLPFLLFLPQPFAGVAAVAIIVTQGWLMVSGNFAWLNALTLLLATSALPDAWFGRAVEVVGATPPMETTPRWFVALVGVVFVAQVMMSWFPVANMLSPHQRMNASFNPLHLVGTYGAFGRITRDRFELIIEGTRDPEPGPDSDWHEYGFPAKPGDPTRRPPQVAPYHLRLDWLLWFAAMSAAPTAQHRWFSVLLRRLVEGDPLIRRLVRRDPFDGEAPTAVRVRRYRYRFTPRAQRREDGTWWSRTLVGDVTGIVPR